jgi:nucleoside phosphorylase
VELKPAVDGVIFFAVPEEAGPFRNAWNRTTGRSFERQAGQIWRHGSWEIRVTGMGTRRAAADATKALEGRTVRWAITAGFAGGLDPALAHGTVGYHADPSFPALSGLTAVGARAVAFHESRQVLVTPEAKAQVYRQTGCHAVEMESTTIRRICQERGVSSATVRVISDAADEALPLDFGALMKPDDSLDFVRLALTLVKSPGKIPELMRFQGRVRVAADRLAAVLVTVLQQAGR